MESVKLVVRDEKMGEEGRRGPPGEKCPPKGGKSNSGHLGRKKGGQETVRAPRKTDKGRVQKIEEPDVVQPHKVRGPSIPKRGSLQKKWGNPENRESEKKQVN